MARGIIPSYVLCQLVFATCWTCGMSPTCMLRMVNSMSINLSGFQFFSENYSRFLFLNKEIQKNGGHESWKYFVRPFSIGDMFTKVAKAQFSGRGYLSRSLYLMTNIYIRIGQVGSNGTRPKKGRTSCILKSG